MTIYWCVLQDGSHNSVTASNNFEAQRRARTLGARELWVKNMSSGAKATQLQF